MSTIRILFIIWLLPLLSQAGNKRKAEVTTYPLPAIYQKSKHFSLRVSNVDVPICDYNDKYDYAHLIVTDGELEIQIDLPTEAITSYQISPLKHGIAAKVVGKSLGFKLETALYLIVKINNKKELVIAIDKKNKMPHASGRGVFNVLTDYKADASGRELSTTSVQKAIDDASAFGGGEVHVPAGVYLLGNIELKSNCSIYLAPGAVFLFSGKAGDYAVHAKKVSQNRNITWWLYTKAGAKNIRLYGAGTLDGNGKVATEKGKIGNHILAIMGATNFTMDGLLVRNSGAWAILPIRSKNIKLLNFKLLNRFDMGENDGVDVIESENVLVKHAIGIALDDPFSTKTWKQETDLCRNWPGMPIPLRNVRFEDCISWTYCYGFKIGQGVMQPQSEIRFTNCVVYDAAVGIGIHHKWGTAAVNSVVFDEIDIEKLSYQNDDHRTWAVFFMQNGDKLGSGPVSDVKVRNILVRDAGKSPGKIRGLNANSAFNRIEFKNVQMPNKNRSAIDLQEMKLTDTLFANQVSVKP